MFKTDSHGQSYYVFTKKEKRKPKKRKEIRVTKLTRKDVKKFCHGNLAHRKPIVRINKKLREAGWDQRKLNVVDRSGYLIRTGVMLIGEGGRYGTPVKRDPGSSGENRG